MALKLGTENKTKTYAAIGLSAIMLILAVHFIYDQFFSTPAAAPAVATTAVAVPRVESPARSSDPASSRIAVAGTAEPRAATQVASASTLDPTLHPEQMAQAEAVTYTGDGRNIFSANSAPAPKAVTIEPVRGPIRPQPVVDAGPPPPPPPPNIDLKFFGYYSSAGAALHKVCLMHGEDLFIAAEGEVVDRRYKVVKINPFSVEVEDMAYNHNQTLTLTQN